MKANAMSLHDGGQEIREKMLALINEANDYILIDSFLVSSAGPAREVIDALKAKHREGVRVYILADSISRYVPEKAAFDYLEEIGIPCAEYNSLMASKLLVVPVLFIRDHRKFWVVDGKVLFLGGANLNPSSLSGSEEGGNSDLMIAVECRDAVSEMVTAFVEAWNITSTLHLERSDFVVQKQSEGEVSMWLFNQQLSGKSACVVPMVEGLFAMAQKEIWVLQTYTISNPDLIKMVKAASKRGVKVNFIFDGAPRYQRFRYASHFGIKSILDAGGRVWIHDNGELPLHYKTILVDDHLVEVGSANLNFRSYHLSKEVSLVIADKLCAQKVRKKMQDLLIDSREVTGVEADQYQGLCYSTRWALMQFGG